MALGTFGSTLSDELNRLANGGTYRTMASMVDDALAAKQWANRENINPYSTDTVGILNEIAGLGLDKKNWLDFNGVCNYIAGTTGLPAAAALRQVYNTTDLLTSQSAYYVDATAPTNWGSLGYVYLNGVSGNYLSVPDSNALDVTGDIDIRVKVAMDDWTPAVATRLLSKYLSTGNQRSYQFWVETDGKLSFGWSVDGTSITPPTATSSIATGVTDGSVKWVRATLDVNNGAGTPQYEVKFYTSDDGSSWTQLGSTVTGTTGVTSIYAGTSQVEIGSISFGTASLLAGKIYNVQIFADLTGTDKRLDINIASNYTSASQSTFTATTGQTVTVNGVDTIANLGSAGSLLPTTLGSSTAADSNDPKFLDFTGTNYVYTPGVNSNYLSVPDAAALDITGDIDLRVQVALDDWTPSATGMFLAKANAANTDYSYAFYISTSGVLNIAWTADGSTVISKTSTVAPIVTDGAPLWVRVTLDVDNGASGNDVKFFTSNDGIVWTQLGTTVTTAGVTSIWNSTQALSVGAKVDGTTIAGKIYRAQVYNGINGTKVLDVDTSVITAGSQTSFTAVTGQTVTINRSTSGRKTVAVTQPTWLFGTDDYMEVNNRYMSSGTYLYLPGVGGNSASTPNAAPLQITGDIDIRVKVAADDWTPSATNTLLAKYGAAGNRSYQLNLNSDGTLTLNWTTDGTNGIAKASTVSTGITDGTIKWVRATLDVDNGASGNDVIFYTSDDGTNWTKLGNTVTTAGTTSIYNSTQLLEIGQWNTNNPARGKFFRAQVLNGINGTVAFDANFESSITSLLQTSFTESSANAATVTINRSGSAYRSAGITTAGYLYPGATNTFTASATSWLDFGLTDSFTVLWVGRTWATSPNVARFLSKRDTNSPFIGYYLYNNGTLAGRPVFEISDGTNVPTTSGLAGAYTLGATTTITGIRNTATDSIIYYNNTTAGGNAVTDTTTGTLFNNGTFRFGASGSGNYNDMELIAGAVFRSALTASQIRQISNYFANREVYL